MEETSFNGIANTQKKFAEIESQIWENKTHNNKWTIARVGLLYLQRPGPIRRPTNDNTSTLLDKQNTPPPNFFIM